MLINPYKTRLQVIQGTHILEDSLGLSGFQFAASAEPARVWTLQYLLEPVTRRHLGGIRAKFQDEKSFISFCNQRDLEVLLGVAAPGEYCPWTDGDYIAEGEPGWYGLCVDDDDLLDDLFERELRLREQYQILPDNIELTRRVHDSGSDCQELYVLLADADESGYRPDPRIETLLRRWTRIERTALKWRYTE